MRTRFLALFFAVAALTSGDAAARRDLYADFRALSAREREGVDYAIAVLDRASATTVLAIHGGEIEPESDRIASDLAGADWNFYAFKGLKPGRDRDLHITSARFDEPRALALTARSQRCVSVHGFRSKDAVVCVGGGDTAGSARLATALRRLSADFGIQTRCRGLEGVSPANIVNRCRNPGIQLEFSTAARDRIARDPALARRLRDTLRSALEADPGFR